MAKYTVTRSCGHSETHQLYGKYTERERKIAWMETTLCRECYRAKQADDAAAKTRDAGLPELTGTPKQIAWAESIRAAAIKDANRLRDAVRKGLEAHPDKADDASIIENEIDAYMAEVSAHEWIERRDYHYTNIRERAAAAVKAANV